MLRPRLRQLFKEDKMIRTGKKELEFIGTIDRCNVSAILLTDIRLADTNVLLTDHVWLGYRDCHDGYREFNNDYEYNYADYLTLKNLGSKRNRKIYRGRHVRFTARIMTYDYSDGEYGLYYTANSKFVLLD